MPKEIYIPLEEAAQAEGVRYNTLIQRMKRSPGSFKTKSLPRESGGKELVQVAVSSLSPKGRRAYRKAQEVEKGGAEAVEDFKARPWYVDIDHNWYIENNREKYQEAVRLADQLRAYLDYGEAERTAYAQQTADRLGLSLRTLYRYVDSMLEAGAWALRLERQDGQSRDYFRALSLCRKPREVGTFPSLTEEQKALIENIWFDREASRNKYTFENAYEDFYKEAHRRGWTELPSGKTIGRYIQHVMDLPGARGAHYLIATNKKSWENVMMPKCTRDTTSLQVLEYIVADAHTFDFWVKYTYPNGKVKAVRPVLVAWIDVRSRVIFGDIFCLSSTSQVVKESVVKTIYSEIGGVPKYSHTDNGKDFTAAEMLGHSRKQRVVMDSETAGFYLSMGIKDTSRSLPFRPWTKAQIERAFGTVCTKFSKRFSSYTGTLTGSRTDGKIPKDIPRMLERGELLTMEEAYAAWSEWLMNDYLKRPHSGLKKAGEKWTCPLDLFLNAERYEKAAPPREYAAMLLMKAATATVTNQGIHRFNTLYTSEELGKYINQKVGIKWDLDDVTKLYVYAKDGHKICEAYSAQALGFGDHVSQEALEKHLRWQKREYAEQKAFGLERQMPYEQRVAEGRAPGVVGRLELTLGHAPTPKVVSLPADKEYRGEVAARTTRRKAQAGNEFFSRKADEALASLRAMNE